MEGRSHINGTGAIKWVRMLNCFVLSCCSSKWHATVVLCAAMLGIYYGVEMLDGQLVS